MVLFRGEALLKKAMAVDYRFMAGGCRDVERQGLSKIGKTMEEEENYCSGVQELFQLRRWFVFAKKKKYCLDPSISRQYQNGNIRLQGINNRGKCICLLLLL